MKLKKSTMKARNCGLLMLMATLVFGCEWDERVVTRDAGRSTSHPGRDQSVATRHQRAPAPPLAKLEEAEERREMAEPLVASRSGPWKDLAFAHQDAEPVDHVARAREMLADSDRAAAMIELGKALYDEPEHFEAACLLGRVAWRAGDRDTARRAYLLATEIDPGRAGAWVQLGRLAFAGENLEEAEDLARHAVSLDPEDAGAHNLQGRVWLKRSHWHRAVASFGKAVQLAPDNRFYRNNLGLACLMKREYGRAVEVLQGVADQGEAPAFVYNNLGLAYEGAGRLQDAIASFRDALQRKPGYVNAKINLKRLVTLAQREEMSGVEEPDPLKRPLAEPQDEPGDLILAVPNEE